MTLPIIFMYSGQGSQYYQMGRSLYEENEIFKSEMLKADQYYKEAIGFSVLDQLYNDQLKKSQPFSQTLLTHPAIFMVEHALTQVLFAKNIIPDIVLGASMGEFAATVAAGILTFESALLAVIKKAQILENCPPGGMLAILSDPNLYKSQAYLYENSELAAINFASHFVVSGSNENLIMITKKLNENNITYQMLPVSQAFHSSFIDGAKVPFLEAIKTLQIKEPEMPYISCTQASPVSSLAQTHFWDIARKPILFQSTIQYIEKQQAVIYIDIGPSGTLATFVKYNLSSLSQSIQFPILTPFSNDTDNLLKISNYLLKQNN